MLRRHKGMPASAAFGERRGDKSAHKQYQKRHSRPNLMDESHAKGVTLGKARDRTPSEPSENQTKDHTRDGTIPDQESSLPIRSTINRCIVPVVIISRHDYDKFRHSLDRLKDTGQSSFSCLYCLISKGPII